MNDGNDAQLLSVFCRERISWHHFFVNSNIIFMNDVPNMMDEMEHHNYFQFRHCVW